MNALILPESALENSILVVAHPDDEILWFGSIVDRVDRIVICFLDDPDKPKLGEARRASLESHPLKHKITSLSITETGAFNKANWPLPELSSCGVVITRNSNISEEYDRAARELRQELAPLLNRADNIFTHNPWGEYGHEEHIMVHRIVSSITNDTCCQVWHSNYVSGWSQQLMETYVSSVNQRYHVGSVDVSAMQEYARCYIDNGAWTWMKNYAWFPQECFLQSPSQSDKPVIGGWLCPLNYIRLPSRISVTPPVELAFSKRLIRKLRKSSSCLRKSR